MRLHSVRLEQWRNYLAPREFRFSEGRIQIVHGPNGSGKSTLSGAIHAAFFLSYKSLAAQATALQPWGKILAPRVEVEFSVGTQRYRVAKQYLQGRQAVLSQERNGLWEQLASHEAAEEQLAKLLDLDQSLAAVLWARQGELHLSGAGDSVRAAVQESLGLQASSGRARALERSIESEYSKYFTPGGKLRTGSSEPALARLKRELADLSQQLDSAKTALTRLEQAQTRLAWTSGHEAELAQQIAAAEAALARAEKADGDFQTWQQKVAPLKPELSQREQELAAILRAEQAEATLLRESKEMETRLATFDQVPAAEAELAASILALQAPSQEELERLTRLQHECKLVEASIGAARVELVLRPLGAPEQLVTGDPNVEVEIPGYGWVEARVPNAGGKELAARRAALRQDLPQDVDLEELSRRVAQARRSTKDLEQLRSRRESGRATLQVLLEEKRKQLAALTPANPERKDQLTADIHIRRTQLDLLDAERQQWPADPRAHRLEAQSTLEQRRKQAATLREEQAALRQEIESEMERSPYQSTNSLEERLALSKQEHDRENLRVNAIRLLRDTMMQERQQLLGRYTEPVAERSAALLAMLAGDNWGRIRVSSALHPEQFLPSRAGTAVSLKELSGGEVEQVHLAVRLALAEALAAGQPQLVLLDDVVLASDQVRLERLLQHLQNKRDQLQVLLLTCHPERFESLREKANWLSLDGPVLDLRRDLS